MESRLYNYRITPRVVKVGEITAVSVEGLDESTRFYDELEYEVKIVEQDGYVFADGFSMPPKVETEGNIFKTKSQGGVIEFSHAFRSFGIHTVMISALSEKPCPQTRKRFTRKTAERNEVTFSVFALDGDLYGKIPHKGDLHMHTYGSDGEESPVLMAAKCRKRGYDFISITDHFSMVPSLDAVEVFEGIPTKFRIFPGEEVHLPEGYLHTFHIVNFNGKHSVNDILAKNFSDIENQISRRADELSAEALDVADATLLAWYEWVHERINEAGGVMIFPHPHWEVGKRYVLRGSTTKEIYKRGLTDVMEILGGTSRENNLLQVQLYYSMREAGYKYPIVASSDAHDTVVDKRFSRLWTVTLAEDTDSIPDAVRSGMSVAVEALGEEKTLYGDQRLVRYAWFLMNEYFPRHDELCLAAGLAIEGYVLGDKNSKLLVELTERRVSGYVADFFGLGTAK